MIAIEYTDIINRITTTVIATAPMLLTISVILKWSAAPGVAAGVACQRTKSRLSAFVPRMLVRIVTVRPPRKVSYKLEPFTADRGRRRYYRQPPRVLVRHEVIDDDAGNFNRHARQLCRRELRRPRRCDCRALQ